MIITILPTIYEIQYASWKGWMTELSSRERHLFEVRKKQHELRQIIIIIIINTTPLLH
jgi:hypothetical protein